MMQLPSDEAIIRHTITILLLITSIEVVASFAKHAWSILTR